MVNYIGIILTEQPSNRTPDPVSAFRKGIKRDSSNFPDFTHERQWDNFHRGLLAEAYAQDVADVLDPTYAPRSREDAALFDLKQDYMYAAFIRILKVDFAKGLVRQHERNRDAQVVFAKLLTRYRDSTKSSLDSSMLLTYITTARLGSGGSWKGPTTGFLTHWKDQVRQYHSLVPDHSIFSDEQQLTMLQNAVHPIPELRMVKTTADQLRTQLGQPVTLESYASLLESACAQYDDQFTNPARKPTKRAIYMHDIQEEYDGDDLNDEQGYDIDSDSHTILANAAMRPNDRYSDRGSGDRMGKATGSYPNRAGTRMGGDKWRKLSPEMKSIWDRLDDESKRIILGNDTKRTINLHDLSAYELLQLQAHRHELVPDDDEPFEDAQQDDQPDEPNPGEPDLLVNAAKSKRVHPGDIRKLL